MVSLGVICEWPNHILLSVLAPGSSGVVRDEAITAWHSVWVALGPSVGLPPTCMWLQGVDWWHVQSVDWSGLRQPALAEPGSVRVSACHRVVVRMCSQHAHYR